jgi:uncharacterized protein YuzE
MLYLIQSVTDKFFEMLHQDPVRPHIPHTERVGLNKDIFVFRDENESVKAITCVSYQKTIPTRESELFEKSEEIDTAVFYTIWSYVPGAGRALLFDAVKHIKNTNPDIKRFVTLSPKTELAKRFHLKNGAIVYRENEETVNYEYENS